MRFIKLRYLLIACAVVALTDSALVFVQFKKIADAPAELPEISAEESDVEEVLSYDTPIEVPSTEGADSDAVLEDGVQQKKYEAEAQQIDFYTLVEGIYTTAPTDGSFYSVQKLEANASMQLISDEEIASLYLVWNELPGSFGVSVDGQVTEYDGSTFLHQFISLPEAGHDVALITPDRDTQLCDVYAFSEGYPPKWVQTWRTLTEDERADILLFPTHADDEFLFFGGIIPLYAGERGLNVQVVYMTMHTGEYWSRNHELLNGLWAAGDDIYPIVNQQEDFKFGTLYAAADYYGYDNFTGFQVEQIRRFKPSVIVGQDFNGEYGHTAHMFNSKCLADAVVIASDSSAYPESAEKYGLWDTPKLYIHLYRDNRISLDYETPLESFGGMTAAEAAQQAYECHYSQQIWYSEVYLQGPYDSHVFGLYRSSVGEDTSGGDIMENITDFSGDGKT